MGKSNHAQKMMYALGDTQEASREWKFGRVNSVFALGGVA
jgi:hypothetical protein